VELLGVMQFRDGDIVRWREYFDPRPLLERSGRMAEFERGGCRFMVN
jgi:limonene-1,2-epoxide hydrolase